MDMTRQFNIIKEDLEDLKKSLSKQKPMELPEDSSQVEVDSDMSRPETADNNTISEYDQSIFIARRTVGLKGIYPSDIDSLDWLAPGMTVKPCSLQSESILSMK